MKEIVILSGVGADGTFVEYKGKGTARAIKMRLTKERNNGKWAKAYEFSHTIGENRKVYKNFETGDMLWIPYDVIDKRW